MWQSTSLPSPNSCRPPGKNKRTQAVFLPTAIFSRAAHRAERVIFFGALASLIFSLPARAGDLLRGGATMSSSSHAPTGIDAGQAAAAQTKALAADRLARTTQALQSVQAMQT